MSKKSSAGPIAIARVALDVPVDEPFDFLAPGLQGGDAGRLVTVPFGKRRAVGMVLDVSDHSAVPVDRLRAIEGVIDTIPPLARIDLALFEFCAEYYRHPVGQVIMGALPPAFRSPRPTRPSAEKFYQLSAAVRSDPDFRLATRSASQQMVFSRLAECTGAAARSVLTEGVARGADALRALVERGVIEATAPAPGRFGGAAVPAYALNSDQARAVSTVSAALGAFQVFLLHGITGSGKTEVYLRVIAQALARGQQVLVLVPEINLTPQLRQAFAARFSGTPLLSIHSGLPQGERARAWLEAQAGRARIVLGTRLALFTPLPELGLIVVDEEHDASFKQQDGLRYSARDVAIYRGRLAECPVLLGSATPSLETWANAQPDAGAPARYTALSLPRRAVADAKLATIRAVDIEHEPCTDGLGATLLAALSERLGRGEQSLLFINRRGFSPSLVCRQCAWTPECRNCSARLVFHKGAARLRCHHCGYQARVPSVCAECGSVDLAPAGQGTQRIEAALAERFPSARIARVDRDSTRRRGSAERLFDSARAGDIDILVGTQMLSKGHDFPRLTLVGVLNADDALFSADFRAPERLFAQLVQVAGRAGRADRPGDVLIQTRFPGHPLYAAVLAQDYPRFAAALLEERRLSGMPPFSFLALLRVEARAPGAALAFAAQARTLGAAALTGNADVTLFDAVPPPLERKGGWERAQVLAQARSRPALQRFLGAWRTAIQAAAPRSVRWTIDVDPIDV